MVRQKSLESGDVARVNEVCCRDALHTSAGGRRESDEVLARRHRSIHVGERTHTKSPQAHHEASPMRTRGGHGAQIPGIPLGDQLGERASSVARYRKGFGSERAMQTAGEKVE